MRTKKSLLAAAVCTALLGGSSIAYAGTNVTETVTTGGGTYNSIKVTGDGKTSSQVYTYGVDHLPSGETITMDGEQLIEVKDIGTASKPLANVIGVWGGTLSASDLNLTAAATGGTAESTSANAVAYGLFVNNNGTNNTITGNATIMVTATGGKATSTSGYAFAKAYGLYGNNTISGDGTVKVTAEGGTGTIDAYAMAYGINTSGGTNSITGDGDITVTANGGKALDRIVINAKAYGLYAKTGGTNTIGNNSGKTVDTKIEVTAIGWKKTDNDGTLSKSADAIACGMYSNGTSSSNTIKDNADITVKAYGGDGTYAASASATGLEGTNIIGTEDAKKDAKVTAEAKGGTGEFAYGQAYGLYGTNIINGNGTVTIEATGGIGNSAFATAMGLYGNNTISGNCTVKVTATGGTGVDFALASAFGIYGANTINGNYTVVATAMGGTENAKAYGLYANGTNTIGGNADITVKASVNKVGAVFKAQSLYAEGTSKTFGTNVLTAAGKIRKIQGDVYAASYGTNSVVMDTKDSYLQGNIISEKKSGNDAPYGTNNITISNAAVWRPVYDNRYGTDCVAYDDTDAATKNVATNKVSERSTTYDTTSNSGTTITLNENGIIDLTWDGWSTDHKTYDITHAYRSSENGGFRNLAVANLKGADGILRVDSNLAKNLSDTLTVGSASTATSLKVQVNYDNFYANSVKGDLVTGKALVVTDNSSGKTLTVSGTKSEYNEKTYNVTVEKDATETNKWNITKIEDIGGTPTPNITENTRHAADSRDNVNNIWEIETNSLVKRLGDLRSIGKNTDKYDNMWAKYGHGNQEAGASGRTTEVKYNQFQIGYDKLFARKDGKLYRGIMVSRINGDASYERGNGDTNSTTVGLYQAWIGNKGHFYDVTLRHGKISTDYNVTDLSDNYSTADYSMWATTLSGEYGYRKDLGKGAYIEPSAELILGHVGSADYTTSKNMNVYLDATKHAITRLGFMAGKDFGKANAYFKANYYHDFAGGGALTTGTVNYENDAAKNWEEIGIGGNVQLSKNASAYAEVRKLFGNVKSNVNFSVGARWSF